jgi:PAS domain S-box-containing protein
VSAACTAALTPERTQEVILNAMSEMVVCHDTTMTIVWANRAAGASVGVGPEQLIGRKCYNVWHQRSAPCPTCPVARVLQTGKPAQDDVRTPDGRTWTVYGSPLFDAHGTLIGAIELTQDSTARTMLAEALRASEERFHTLVEKTNDIIWELDTAGAYTYMNAPGLALAGYKPEEIIGKTPFDLMPPAEAARASAELRGIMARRQPFTLVRSTLCRKDGSLLEIETNGAPVYNVQGVYTGYRGVSRDVTARIRADAALRASEARYRALVELSPEAILQINAEGVISTANQQAATLLGVARAVTLAGRDFFNYIAAADHAHVLACLQQARSTPGTHRIECHMRRGRSDQFVGEITLATAAGATLPVSGLVVVIRDITVRRREQEALQQHHENLGQTLHQRTQELHTTHDRLRESEERFRLVAEHARDGINICVFDPQTRKRRLVYCNDRYVAIAGYPREQLFAAENINDLVLQHATEEERRQQYYCIINGTPFTGTSSWRRPDGQENVYEYTAVSFKKGDEIFIAGVDRDVTERHKDEQRTQQHVAEILAIFNGIEGAMYVADMHTHEILAANHYLERHYGPGLIGRRCYEALQAGQQQPCAFCNNKELLGPDGQPGPPVTWEVQNTRTGLWYRCTSRAIRWPDGRVVRMELALDITAEKTAREALRRSEADLAHAQRIAQVGTVQELSEPAPAADV